MLTNALSHWKTTVGGLLVSIPPLLFSSGVILTLQQQHIVVFVQAVGAMLLGISAADASKTVTKP
jgi:hypothetical protein